MDGVDGKPGVGAESEVMREESVADRVAKLVESCRALQEAASSHSAQRQHEADALSKQAVTHLATLKELQGDLYSGCEKGEISHRTAKKVSFLSFIPLNFFTEVLYVTQQSHVCDSSSCGLSQAIYVELHVEASSLPLSSSLSSSSSKNGFSQRS